MEKKDDHHQLGRRSQQHDYSQSGLYHITIHVAEEGHTGGHRK